jgi:2,5-dihydroxypyridine 5,6-dioxygenase
MIHTDVGPKLARAAMVFVRDMMGVKPGESVLITINTGADLTAVNALQDAAYLIGAKVSTLILAPRLPFQGGLADAYVSDTVQAAVTTCDAWIDLCMPYMAGCHAHDEAMKNGRTRYCLAADLGADEIVRIFGEADLDLLFEFGDIFSDLIEAAEGKEGRVTTADGTDLTFTLAPTKGFALKKADSPGGYFIPGTVVFLPEIETVKGQFVTSAMLHEYYTTNCEPMTLILDGDVKEVIGGGPENKVMMRALERAGQEQPRPRRALHLRFPPDRPLHRPVLHRGSARHRLQRHRPWRSLLGAGRG